MTHTAPEPLHSLVIPTTPFPDESLPGLIARATERNVLAYTRIICTDAGFRSPDHDLGHPSRRHLAERLAGIIGCDANDVVGVSHEARTEHPLEVQASHVVRIGGSECRRGQLLFGSRRVAPSTLAVSPYHRIAWLHARLPFCPHSLELLINQCEKCQSIVRWTQSRGIGICEHCREPLVGGQASPLDLKFADGYRAFSAIAAGIASERQTVVSALAPELGELRPVALSELTFSLGALIRLPHDAPLNDPQDPVELAACGATGHELLLNWPHDAKHAIHAKLEAAKGDRTLLFPFLRKARGLALAQRVPSDQEALVKHAFPELFQHLSRAFRLNPNSMNAEELLRLTSLSSSKIKAVRDAKAIKHTVFREGQRTGVVFDRKACLEFKSRLDQSCPATRLERRLDLPRYGVEQLICLQMIDAETHPAIKVVDPDLRITTASMERFLNAVIAKGIRRDAPKAALTLARASRIIGGDLKPWGAIYAAMLDGTLPFWLNSDTGSGEGASRPLNRIIRVMPEQLSAFRKMRFDGSQYPEFKFSTHVTQRDALEILNLTSAYIHSAIDAGQLRFEQGTKAQWCELSSVLQYARKMITVAELSQHLGILEHKVPEVMLTTHPELEHFEIGWVRDAVMAKLQLD